jgi:RNA polymerase sigma-70 factor (ECF subfamily)
VDEDRSLVTDAAAGSREAFDELVRRHQVRMYTLARVLTGGDSEAEDLVQETFVRAYRAISRFRGDSTFATWLHRIAVNVIKSYLVRRDRRAFTAPLSEGPGNEADRELPIESLPSGEDLEDAVTTRQAIDRALASLPDELRVLVALRDIQGLEYHEIATVTGLPIGTVESRVFRARQRLRPMLEPLREGSLRRRRMVGGADPRGWGPGLW